MLNFWQLNGFEDALDRWISLDDPSLDLRFLVTEWVLGRADDPYVGASRRLEIASNYWLAVVPDPKKATGSSLALLDDEQVRSVRCDMIATLSRPIT